MRQVKLFQEEIYCVDTDVLIELKRHYPSKYVFSKHDLFPGIWEKIEKMVAIGKIISHIEVLNEIKVGGDELFEWSKKHKAMFKDVDECQSSKLEEIEKKYNKQYWDRNIKKPGSWADPWIIALAICEKGVIITNEGNAPNKIPFIASYFSVSCLNLFDFFKKIGIRY